MNFLGNILNGIKGALAQRNIQPQNNISAQPPLQGGVAQTDTTNMQPSNNINKQNAVINALSKVSPTNWQPTTRQAVGNVLNGILQAQYDPNLGVLGSLGRGAVQGRQNQINYMNAKNTLDSYGFDTSGMSPYIDYSSFSPEKIVAMGVQENKNRVRKEIASANDNTKRLQLLLTGLKNGTVTPEEAMAQAKLYGIDFNNLQTSNETKLTNAKVPLTNAQTEYVEAKTEDVKNPKARTYITRKTIDVNNTYNGGGTPKNNKKHKTNAF